MQLKIKKKKIVEELFETAAERNLCSQVDGAQTCISFVPLNSLSI
jgi:hypothetical protein